MGINEAGQNDMARSIKHFARRCRRLLSSPHQLNNLAAPQHKPTASSIAQNCQRIFEPNALHFTFSPFLG
jgi:hypothetical protein